MLRLFKNVSFVSIRTFKNFGHKRQPIPIPTTLWHGFLTFTFIGLAVEWKVISKFLFGEKDYDEELGSTLFSKSDKHTIFETKPLEK